MIKRPILRVMLTGVVGVVLFAGLGGCSQSLKTEEVANAAVQHASDLCSNPEHHGQGRTLLNCDNVDALAAQPSILDGGLLAAETAVDAYTEEPRWEGATDYSQACSPSSGDLGC